MKTITELGLSILSGVRRLMGKEVEYSPSNNRKSVAQAHTIWSSLLKKHVTQEGAVNYQGFIAEKELLLSYTTLLTDNPPSKYWAEREQLAYWINAYNAFTVLLITEYYPVESIKNIAGNIPMINSVWDMKFFKIGTVDFDLNTIEHQILRKQFDDPRIHFAINCASISCPRLRNEAYTSSTLEEQLDEQAALFINNSDYNHVTNERVQLSKIFDWFKGDFTKRKSLLEYIGQYSTAKINNTIKIEYIPYNWNLNELKSQG